VEKNSQDHHHLNVKNVVKNFISHMDHMDPMVHMGQDLMDPHQNLFAKNAEKNLNFQNIHLMKVK
jgi:hypothetical protein